MFQVILWVFVGAILGGLASIVLRLNSGRREALHILAGSVGAFSAGAFWTVGAALFHQLNLVDISLIVSGLGAVALLFLVNAAHRRLPF
jgi:uncharacterized membrane protein YeaQ/YmgE (transglycosylase-associated protein family)